MNLKTKRITSLQTNESTVNKCKAESVSFNFEGTLLCLGHPNCSFGFLFFGLQSICTFSENVHMLTLAVTMSTVATGSVTATRSVTACAKMCLVSFQHFRVGVCLWMLITIKTS